MACLSMKSGFALAFGCLLAVSCKTPAGSTERLLQRTEEAELAAKVARATGVLVREGGCLRLAGNGTTIVVWPLSTDAYSPDASGGTVVIWPRAAVVAQREEGGGTVVVVWPRGVGTGEPVRIGDRIEIEGRYVEDIASFPVALRNDGRCRRGAAIVVREVRAAR
jgi:hypothetical protein